LRKLLQGKYLHIYWFTGVSIPIIFLLSIILFL